MNPCTDRTRPSTKRSAKALVESGAAAVSAGATDAGVLSLRMAVGLADDVGSADLRISARLALAEALIHAIGGLDEDGLATLHEAHDIALADRQVAQAFALACRLGDPCWEGTAARGLALVADMSGDVERAFDLLAEARTRCNRHADPYVWLDAYILDARCELGLRRDHPTPSAGSPRCES